MPIPTLLAAIENAAAAYRDAAENPATTQAQMAAARLSLEQAKETYWTAVATARAALEADSTLLPSAAAAAQNVDVKDLYS